MKFLLTAFNAFDGDKLNASQLALAQLPNKIEGVPLQKLVILQELMCVIWCFIALDIFA